MALETGHNLVHGSDSPETAGREVALWFKPEELVDYERAIDAWILDSD
jgi:nucleoside-diphosphate kinase